MNRTHPALWIAGWAGLAAGALLAALGIVVGGELAQLAGGYGLILMGAALYLLGGLGLRRALARRTLPNDSGAPVAAGRPTLNQP